MKTSSKGDKPLSTTKKQKLVGVQSFVDTSTGEVVPMQIVQVEDRDFSFHKVWLRNLVTSLEGISSQRLKLAFWILDNLNSENQLVMTWKRISEKSGMSMATVARTMTALQDGNPAFLQKINSGAYRVNPEVIWKGSHSKRMGVCYEYTETIREQREQKEEEEISEEPEEAPEELQAGLEGWESSPEEEPPKEEV